MIPKPFKLKLAIITVSLSLFLLIYTPTGFGAAEDRQSAPTNILLTAKERLSNKAADNQHINNCKVPPERRGAKPRPEACKTNAIVGLDATMQRTSGNY